MWEITLDLHITGTIRVSEVPDAGTAGVITFTTSKEESMGEITVKADEATLKAKVVYTDSEGNPTAPDSTPRWEVSDPSVLTVHPSEDGLSATFDVGAPGVSSVVVRTIEYTGPEEGHEILLSGLVTVVAGDTVAGSIDFSVDEP